MSFKSIKIFLIYYLPPIIWMGIIFYLSSIAGLKTGAIIPVEIVLRKAAHLFEYIFLSFLFWRIFYWRWKLSAFKSGVLAFSLTVIYAASDEIHQSFVENRAGRATDVAVDATGGLLGVILSKNLFASKRR
ncbi:MAG: VanZ family protein [Candidatus Moranbacteria bacterium]|nr:VanZ family protein [Candidatus Moranbacteria bacterium]